MNPNAEATGIVRLVVPPRQDGERLDRFVAEATGWPRRRVRALIAEGRVWRNGEAVRVQSRTLEPGDVVDALTGPGLPPVARPADPSMPPVLLEDRWLVAVDKPAGVLSQPAENMAEGELALDQQLLMAMAYRDGRRSFLRLVHRLDRTTSGVLLFARTQEALAPLDRAWREGHAERRYLAIVTGDPASAPATTVVDQPIGRDPGHPWRFRVDDAGRPARTEVEIVTGMVPGTLIARCRLRTGRTHQVRVHLAALGFPVLGDRLYGGQPGPERPLLHAHTLGFPHPRSGQRVTVVSPPPADLTPYLPEPMPSLDTLR